ncbi:MAG: NAD(P)/FAD-dependent oxidoreductase [Traorella sp.]
MRIVDCVIVGGGSAAMSCAIAASKYGVKDILMIERNDDLGGILNQCIHNGFGLQIFKKECSGPEYAELLVQSMKKYHIDVKLNTSVTSISEDKRITYINEEGAVEIQAKAIVLASGCLERSRGMISIPGSRCNNVMSAGTAQRYLNIDGYLVGKKVFILGSGDIGLIMARRMVLEGASVIGVAEIMPYSNGLTRNIVQCLEDFDIPLYLSTTVTKIIGQNKIEKIELSKVDENLKPIVGSEWYVDVDCLLLSVGLLPEISLLDKLNVDRDSKTKSVKINECNEMSIPGFFICGNALQVHDLVDYVSMEAENCGKQVARYLNNEIIETNGFDVVSGKNVSYVVPQLIRIENVDFDRKFSFRVTKPMKNCLLRIKSEDQILKEVKKKVMIPAEMEMIDLEKAMLKEVSHTLIFEVEEEAW